VLSSEQQQEEEAPRAYLAAEAEEAGCEEPVGHCSMQRGKELVAACLRRGLGALGAQRVEALMAVEGEVPPAGETTAGARLAAEAARRHCRASG